MTTSHNNYNLPAFPLPLRPINLALINTPYFPSSMDISSATALLGKRASNPTYIKPKEVQKKQRKTLEQYTAIQAAQEESHRRAVLTVQQYTPAYRAPVSQSDQQFQLQLLREMTQYKQLVSNFCHRQANTPSPKKKEPKVVRKDKKSVLEKIQGYEQAISEASEKSTSVEVKTEESDDIEREARQITVKINVEEEEGVQSKETGKTDLEMVKINVEEAQEQEKKVYEPIEEPALFSITRKFPGWNLCTIYNFLNSERGEKEFDIFDNIPVRSMRSCRLKTIVEKAEEHERVKTRKSGKRGPRKVEAVKEEDLTVHEKLEYISEGI